MRTFYIFKINNEFKILTKDKPYNLYLALSSIKKMDKNEVSLAYTLYNQICDYNKLSSLNKEIFDGLKKSDYYTKFNSTHLINNYYTTESSSLTVNKTFLKINTSTNNPTFFKVLKNIPNLFVIDFNEKDYFWLS